MSENTIVTIIKGQKIEDIMKCIKKEKIEAFVFGVNMYWSAVIFNEQTTLESTKILSQRLGAYTIIFYNSDFGWGCDVFICGVKKSSFSMNYELEIPEYNPDKQVFLGLLRELGGLESEINTLEDYLSNFGNEKYSIFDGVNFFTRSFGIDALHGVSFYELSQLNEDKLKHLNIKSICNKENNKKMKSFKKLLLETWENTLNSYGFKYVSNDKMGYDYAFLKTIDGFDIGILVIKSQSDYGIILKSQFEEVPLVLLDQKINMFTYDNEYQLTKILKEALDTIVSKGIEIIERDKLDSFYLNIIYETIVDQFFNIYGFKRTHVDNNLLIGGSVIYKKSKMEIIFMHTPFFVAVGCFISQGGEKTSLDDLIKDKDEDNDTTFYQFRNKEEYISIINKLLNKIKYICFSNLNN